MVVIVWQLDLSNYLIILYNYNNTDFTKLMDNEYKIPNKIIHNMAGMFIEVTLIIIYSIAKTKYGLHSYSYLSSLAIVYLIIR